MRHQVLAGIILAGVGLSGAWPAQGQITGVDPIRKPATTTTPDAPRPGPSQEELEIAKALQSDPMTAAYRIRIVYRGGKATLSGRVGTSFVHDAAVRTVIALGYPVQDNLVIDSSELVRVNVAAALRGQIPPPAVPLAVYPPNLYRYLDDPFVGFEPPLVTYPPYWESVKKREPISNKVLNAVGNGMSAIDPGAAGPPASMQGQGVGPRPLGNLPKDTVEATIDGNGVAVLRGVVKTLDERIGIGQKLSKQPGVTQVINLLIVDPNFQAGGPGDIPPPPPTPPTLPGDPERAIGPAPAPVRVVPDEARTPVLPMDVERPRVPVHVDGDPLSRRISESMAKRPALEGLGIKVTNHAGSVLLSGKVPSAFEAMIAYRTAEQTPGVRDVEDRLEFTLPDADAPNPLKTRGRPEDIEPYLLAQVRRQVGDLAHVDQLRLEGDTIQIRGTLGRADDSARVEATLRSIPLLRGFRIEPSFVAE